MSFKSNTVVQFIFSALLGFIAAFGYLLTAYLLDDSLGYNVANIIGLIVDHIINFFLQYELFVGKQPYARKEFFIKFTIGNIISIIFTQTVFVMFHRYIRCYHPDFYKTKFNKHVTLIRYLLGAITYICVSFPLRKYYMFRHTYSLFL